ncbi:MAG: HAMP domain-containing sensor histidine kinase [Nocardioides sp.]
MPRPRELELAELTDDMNTLGRALADTEARRVRLLGEVAHELRTPLTVADGYVEGMIDGVVEPSTQRLGQVAEELRRMRRLADDLSLLSRAEEGRLGLHLAPLDLAVVAGAAAERLRPQAEDAGLDLEVDRPTDPLPLTGDADRLAQVVTNLVGNAVRATPPGGRISVACGRDGGDLLTVSDTGEGLTQGDLALVFERFYRVPGARAGAGTGIGLPIARGIVAAHGGTLTATSAGRGLGATFTVRLPLHS